MGMETAPKKMQNARFVRWKEEKRTGDEEYAQR
jgi:hypothetical protein